MIVNPSIQGMLRDLVDNLVFIAVNAGAPTSGTSGTGVGLCGPGAILIDSTNKILYINTGTLASPTWTAVGSGGTISGATIDNTNTVNLLDTLFRLQDNGDATKQLAFQLSGLTTATTRTITIPDSDLTLVGLTNTQTLTGKTIPITVLALAAAGTNQGNAAAITGAYPAIVVVSGADDTVGVKLPTAVAGMKFHIKSTVANKILKIYPATGGTINALAGDVAISFASGPTVATFIATSTTQWYTIPLLPS